MKEFFLFDVDTQRDLMLSDGALYVPGAARMIPKVRRLFDFARTNAVTIISSAIANDPGGSAAGKFPIHCVRGTEGQRKIDDTLLLHPLVLENKQVDRNYAELVRKHPQIIVEKNGFDVFGNPVFGRLLRVLPQRAILFGVPLEYAIKLAALGLRQLGHKAVVVQNASLPLEPREAGKAEAEMRRAGVEFITLEILLAALGAD